MQSDPILAYFAEEQQQKYQNYMMKISIEQFKQLVSLRLKEQYKFLNSCNILSSKKKETFQLSKTHGISQIWGTRMRSIVDNEIYSIFCEAPGKAIMGDFWNTCYNEKVTQIYMLLPNWSSYWPDLNEQISFNQFQITIFCNKKEQVNKHLDKRSITIKGPNGDRIIWHFHFKSWLDGCIPQGEDACAVYQGLVKEAVKNLQNKGLMLIHCRAGIGRTGTFAATIQAYRLAQKTNKISLFEIVANMRLYRLYCVETIEQYSFVQKQIKQLL